MKAYQMYSFPDKSTHQESLPAGCERLVEETGMGRVWGPLWVTETKEPSKWGTCPRRWPVEQDTRPTPYAFLTDAEKKELSAACRRGEEIEALTSNGEWSTTCDFSRPAFPGYAYRIKPEAKQDIKLTLTINGEAISPAELSEESWNALRTKGE